MQAGLSLRCYFAAFAAAAATSASMRSLMLAYLRMGQQLLRNCCLSLDVDDDRIVNRNVAYAERAVHIGSIQRSTNG